MLTVTVNLQGRVFLMLQGPQSKFFVQLAQRLTGLGGRVIKVNLCGGDLLLWGRGVPGTHCLNYHGRACNWPAFVSGLFAANAVTDLLVYGDWRPLHQDAVLIAKDRGIAVWVFEEGYLRRGFSTMEAGGVNGRSSLPRDAETIREQAQVLPPFKEGETFEESIFLKVRYAIAHHFGNVLFFPLFLFYRTHRPHNILVELTGILPRYLTRGRRKLRSARVLGKFLRSGRPYFFYPLQLSSDSQIQLYSPYIRQEEAITTVIASFARYAPQDSLLLIKDHPLDNGMTPYASFISSMASALGCADRVLFVADGNVNALVARARGVVLINSTVGLTALLAKKPVYCLGFAIYAVPGLAQWAGRQQLADFWQSPQQPDPDMLQSFCRVLKRYALIPGNFYTLQGMQRALDGTIERLLLDGQQNNQSCVWIVQGSDCSSVRIPEATEAVKSTTTSAACKKSAAVINTRSLSACSYVREEEINGFNVLQILAQSEKGKSLYTGEVALC